MALGICSFERKPVAGTGLGIICASALCAAHDDMAAVLPPDETEDCDMLR